MKLFFIAIALAFTACTSTSSNTTPVVPGTSPTPSDSLACNLEQTVAASMANGVAAALGCSNEAQIQNDMMTAVGKANLCKASGGRRAGGVIGDTVCPFIISQVITIGMNQVPQQWGCGGSTTVDQVKSKLNDLCTANVKF